jgi:3-phosphoshikimate 1-carboxyvinyltransferase
MVESLGRLGIRVESRDQGKTLIVHGCSGRIPANSADLFVGNSGTTIRFLTALCTLGHGTYRLDGVERMRERPIGDLLTALNQLGAGCRGEIRDGFPPVVVKANGLRGGRTSVRGDISSQFLSGLLMAAPYADGEVEVVVQGDMVSKPYVAMTLRIMEEYGCAVGNVLRVPRTAEVSRPLHFRIAAPQFYKARTYAIEPDASAASYFWASAAITGGEVTVEGLNREALQGDVRFVDCLARMGCDVTYDADRITVSGRAERGIDIDMNAISDTVQTLAAVALFAKGATTIRGVAHIRHKETDRIGDLARELRKFGVTVEEFPDGLSITPQAGRGVGIPPAIPNRGVSEGPPPKIEIETYNDHRMAMSLALPGLVLAGVTILNPGCTAKTYPGYFEDLKRLVG